VKNLSADQNALFVSQGDMWQGSCESNSTRGELVTKWMNQIGFSSMTLGNHEYDWGKQFIASNAKIANFPTLGINVIDLATEKRADYADASVVVEKAGVKVGIIGAIGDCYSSISSSMVKDVRFAQGEELSGLVKAESTRLRNEEECDFIIYSVHDGGDGSGIYSGYDLELSSGNYVDIVFEGHSHNDYRLQDDAGVWHLQGGGYNRTFNHVAIEIDPATNQYEVKIGPEAIRTLAYTDLTNDAETARLMSSYNFSSFYEPIGTNIAERNATVLRQKVADLYLEKGLEKWSREYNIVLGGGYISCRSPGYLGAGEVTYAQLYNLFPFDNNIILGSLSGAKLLSQFINNSNENYFLAYSEYGNGIKDSIVDEETYYIIVDTYSLDYAPNGLTLIDTLDTSGYYARDCMKDFIAAGGFDNTEQGAADAGQSADNPLTVGQAISLAIKNGNDSTNVSEVYCRGRVTQKASRIGTSGDLNNVKICDSEGNEILIYYLKRSADAYSGSEGNWASVDDLPVGTEIIIYGKPFHYNNSTPEFASGTYLVSIIS